jgi:hypothetical protein
MYAVSSAGPHCADDLIYAGVPLVRQKRRSLIARWLHRSPAIGKRPTVVSRDDRAVRLLEDAFQALPESSRAEVRARLMQTIVTFERTMDIAPVLDFMMSVQITARLNVNPQYQSALLDAESESWDEPGIDGRAMIEAANERRRAAQGQAR